MSEVTPLRGAIRRSILIGIGTGHVKHCACRDCRDQIRVTRATEKRDFQRLVAEELYYSED